MTPILLNMSKKPILGLATISGLRTEHAGAW
jgi:hypothetical protein